MGALLDFLFPPKCPFCGRLTNDDSLPCDACQRTLPWLEGPAALGRAEFVDAYACALRHDGPARRCVLVYKFRPQPSYGKLLGRLTAQCVRDHLSGRFDLVTWVPLSRMGRWRRGFDQSRLLARAVAADWGMEPVPLLARKYRPGHQSSLQNYAARRANVLGLYSLLPQARKVLPGQRVLLIDDVITSGATISQCARLLRMGGAVSVVAASATRGIGRPASDPEEV